MPATDAARSHDAAPTIGDAIRESREARGWSKTDLARRLGIGYQTVHRCEIGRNTPSTEQLQKLSEVLAVDLKSLVALATGAHTRTAEWSRFMALAPTATEVELDAVKNTPLGDSPTAEDFMDALEMHRRRLARRQK